MIGLTGLVSMRRAQKGSSDFDTFYHAGRSVLNAEGIYYTGEYHEDERGGVAPFLYPPFAALFFVPLALLPLAPAAFLWNALNIALFAACAALAFQILEVKPPEISALWKTAPRRLKILLIFISAALLLDNLSMAQMNITVFFFTLLALALDQRQKPWAAGIFLALAAVLKVTPVLFFLYFAVKGSWKTAAAGALGCFY